MAAHGYEVDVFEANPYPGGKLSEFRLGGYRFDAGPSLFTMSMYVDELYRLADPAKTPPLSYRRLDVVCHYFWEDGVRLHAHAAPEEFAREAADVLGVDPQAILRALADSRRKYELTGRTFLERSLHRPATWLSREVGSALLQLPSLDIFRSMHQVNQRQLQHPKLVQLFDRFATYNGSNPYRAPGILNIIPHFEHHFGAYFPQGGMHAITEHLYRLALEGGVRFHFEQPVSEIQVEKGRASALVVGERTLRYDRIVSNMDVFFTYRRLLPGQKAPERILAQEKSTSSLIFYWGIRKEFPELGLHNIFFSEDYREEFDLLGRGRISDDPSVYVNITQKYESGDAPAGCENWFTMINVPYNSGQDWDALIARSRKNVLDKLSRILGRAIEPLIEEEALLDPRTIESRTNSHLGALYGTSSNDRMAAFLRHANFSSRIEDLYFCGGSVHPGGGIPLCLLSARIVDQLMHD